jgi:hypothetical protein
MSGNSDISLIVAPYRYAGQKVVPVLLLCDQLVNSLNPTVMAMTQMPHPIQLQPFKHLAHPPHFLLT